MKGLKSVSDVQTQVVDLRPRIRDYKSGEKDYYARQMVSFRLTQLNQYDNVILGLLEKGIDGIGQVMSSGFLQAWHLLFRPKSSIWFHQTR